MRLFKLCLKWAEYADKRTGGAITMPLAEYAFMLYEDLLVSIKAKEPHGAIKRLYDYAEPEVKSEIEKEVKGN